MDGKPLSGAVVFFHPKTADGFQGAMGVTDDSGKYVLETFLGEGKTKKGAIPGRYDVTVSRMAKPDGTPIKYDPKAPPMSDPMAKEQVPMKYSSKNDFGLYYEVPPGGGKYDIEFSSTE
ncbi:MAG: hypothetical protein JSS02_15480 [Planctomycetes bacterium]|nr:hypothetical protein [Planctomycetota bacterium]